MTYPILDLARLKAFVEVASHGSFARAAATLGTAQSVLSRQVSALERDLDGRLFDRTGRGVVVTALGERLLPRGRALIAEAGAFREASRSGREAPSGEVTLGVVPVASRRLVAAVVGAVRDRYPDIRLRAIEAYSGQVEEMLATERIEIGIFNRYREARLPGADLLLRGDMHVITRTGHPAALGAEIALGDLTGVSLALPLRPNSLTSLLTGLAASHHLTLDIRFESGSTSLTREVLLASDLATISAYHVFAAEIASGQVRATRIAHPAIRQMTWMSLASHRPPSEATRAVAALFRRMAASPERLRPDA
ncbi:LysR family transcriptional regulator [Enterovirga rhinocerotis]|nr:LysR family transcriptional regulator [Enterovirga rhinocerotis]